MKDVRVRRIVGVRNEAPQPGDNPLHAPNVGSPLHFPRVQLRGVPHETVRWSHQQRLVPLPFGAEAGRGEFLAAAQSDGFQGAAAGRSLPVHLFKLHSPLDFIAGGGVFVRHSFLPLPLAWQAFGEKNGVPDFDTFERRILDHRDPAELIRQLGCTILVQPFFWPRELWIPVPSDWKKNIVTGKGSMTPKCADCAE